MSAGDVQQDATRRSGPPLRCPGRPRPRAAGERRQDDYGRCRPWQLGALVGLVCSAPSGRGRPRHRRRGRLRHGWALLGIVALLLVLPLRSIAAEGPATQPARFEVVNVYVDSGDKPLAAWQVELKATQGDVKIVGVEGGDHHDLYRDPPYYDPAALSTGRIILASYTTSDRAPKGTVLVARVHLRTVGQYQLTASSMAAAQPDGQPVVATASVSPMPATKPSNVKE